MKAKQAAAANGSAAKGVESGEKSSLLRSPAKTTE